MALLIETDSICQSAFILMFPSVPFDLIDEVFYCHTELQRRIQYPFKHFGQYMFSR
jgi:hypothetical protein